MPFGPIFGALFFGILGIWTGVSLLLRPGSGLALAGLSLIVLGVTLAPALLLRLAWARWIGTGVAVLLAAYALRLVASGGGALEHVLLLAGVATAVLLVVPATGGSAPRGVSGQPRRAGHALAFLATTGVVGLVASLFWPASGEPATAAARTSEAVRRLGRVSWTDFGSGLARAGAEDRPLLVAFETAWCGYCKRMDRETWTAGEVIDRLDALVAVRVDADDEQARNGYSGVELARRYQVRGYPALFLLDSRGEVLSRRDGFLAADELVRWVDGSLGPASAPATGTLQGSNR